MFSVTTLIPTCNHQASIGQAIESALAQKGGFRHQVIVLDDCSTDRTREIAAEHAERSGGIVSLVANASNLGISENYRRGFARCGGDFTAILEGDDYWIDEGKLQKQSAFLLENRDCRMVFSKILVLDESSGRISTLDRQEGIGKSKLTGADFIATPSLNLIANFSSCLFRTGDLARLPEAIYGVRINEIAMAFWFDRLGKIGFIDAAMSVYRRHPGGLWSGKDRRSRLEEGLEIRRRLLEIADGRYRPELMRIIETRYLAPLQDLRAPPA